MYAASTKTPAGYGKKPSRDVSTPPIAGSFPKLVQYKRDKVSTPSNSQPNLSGMVRQQSQRSPQLQQQKQKQQQQQQQQQQSVWSDGRLAKDGKQGTGAGDNQPGGEVAESAPDQYIEGVEGAHPLLFRWSFWFMHRAPGQKITNYESAMIKIASFSTVESFWAVYGHLLRPNQVPTITDYHLFRDGVRPVWEDEENINGGKWMIRMKKGLASRLWERLALAVVGNVFNVGDEICGIVLSIRNSEDILSLWNKSALDAKTNIMICDTIKTVLQIPSETVMEYKAHNDSLKDNSSFRNTDVYK